MHYDLLDIATLITITLKMKLSPIEKHEQTLQKNMFVNVKNIGIQKGFQNSDMYVVIIVELTTIMSSILGF